MAKKETVVDANVEQLQVIVTRNVKIIMALNDLIQQDIAAALGLARSTVAQKLTRAVPWNLDDVARLSTYTGVPAAMLISNSADGLINLLSKESDPLSLTGSDYSFVSGRLDSDLQYLDNKKAERHDVPLDECPRRDSNPGHAD